jgi:hypothetical protein
MQVKESIYSGRATTSMAPHTGAVHLWELCLRSAIVLGALGAWQVPARYRARPVTFVPSEFWPDAVRTAVVDALAAALVRDVVTPPCAPGPAEIST